MRDKAKWFVVDAEAVNAFTEPFASMLMDCCAKLGVGLLMMFEAMEEHVCEIVSDLSPDLELEICIDSLFAKYAMLYVYC